MARGITWVSGKVCAKTINPGGSFFSYLPPSPPYAAFADSGYKIKEAQSALLSNHEVLLHLQEQEREYTGKLVLNSGKDDKPEAETESTAEEKRVEEKNAGEEEKPGQENQPTPDEKSGEAEKKEKKPAEPAVEYQPAREKPKGLKDVLQDVSYYLLRPSLHNPQRTPTPPSPLLSKVLLMARRLWPTSAPHSKSLL